VSFKDEIKSRGALNHLGIEVQDTAEVLAAKKRFADAGLVTVDEMNVDCCFALQDKVWPKTAQPSGCCQATTC
jgi:hypothetical protein